MSPSQWLASAEQDYQTGLDVYASYGVGNAALAFAFSFGPSCYNRNRLREVLQELADRASSPPKPPRQAAKTAALPPSPVSLRPTQERPAVIAAAEKSWRDEFARASHLHQTRLGPSHSKEERYAAAAAILDAFDNIVPNWSLIDYWEANGQLPPAIGKAELPSDRATLQKRLTSLRANLSRDRAKPVKVAKWLAEIAEVQSKLESDGA